ncbi:hypothetical protein LB505_010906 [Fusarium chuoi]|nr:hypothetical protein LB505_010906 [Fusarium chuoi]
MKSKSIMAASAVMELALAQASADSFCSTIINLQPIEYQFQQPILIDSYFPANTDIVLDDGHVVHVTNAPTSLSTVLTDFAMFLAFIPDSTNHFQAVLPAATTTALLQIQATSPSLFLRILMILATILSRRPIPRLSQVSRVL